MNHEIHEIHETERFNDTAQPEVKLDPEQTKARCLCHRPFVYFVYFVVPFLVQLAFASTSQAAPGTSTALSWPPITKFQRPWTYWWWMGSAVDETNLVRELTRYRDAGLGGVHIIPIYGAKGWEDRYVKYLSPRWMELLSFTVTEADKLGLGVDMTTGTGWCFGGPEVTDEEANASVICKIIEVPAGGRLDQKFDPAKTQALMAFGPEDARRDLKGLIDDSGRVDWQPKEGPWRVYAVSQKFSQYGNPPLTGMFQIFQDQGACTFGHDKAVPLAIKRSRGGLRCCISFREGFD